MLQRERDLRDSSLPELVVELSLITAAQLPKLVPLNALLKCEEVFVDNKLSSLETSKPQSKSTLTAASKSMQIIASKEPHVPTVKSLTPSLISNFAPGEKISQNVSDIDQLRKTCSEALKCTSGDFPRTFGSLPYMATDIKLQDNILFCIFPDNVRNTVQSFEKEKTNPHLLNRLRKVFPGLIRISISFESNSNSINGDALRADPIFNRLIADTHGEIIEIRSSKEN
jgi:hypothetical protein